MVPKRIIPQPWHGEARQAVLVNRLILFVGTPGSGKSEVARMVATELSGKKPAVLDGNPGTDLLHLWGHPTISATEYGFVDGPLTEALKHSKFLIIEDFGLIPIEVRTALLGLRLGQREVQNPYTKETLPIPAEFRLIATSNPETLRCRGSRAEGLRALLSDFLAMVVPPLSASATEEILRLECGHSPEPPDRGATQWLLGDPDDSLDGATEDAIARAMWHFDELQRLVDAEAQGGDAAGMLTVRAARNLVKLLHIGLSEARAVELALLNQFILDEDLHTALKLKYSIDMI